MPRCAGTSPAKAALVLELKDLDVAIGPVAILRAVNLTLEAGQFAGLIGRNGAGKTTLLRAIMGLLAPRRGSIALEGSSLAGVAAHHRARRGLGYMPEDRRLIPALGVEENILLPAWARNVGDAQERLQRIYRLMPEVEALRGRRALLLSGGQQKLVALARALMSGDKLLLLDEPFEGVAPALAQRLAEVIGRLRDLGASVILAESSLLHAHGLLDVTYLIDRGEVRRA
jgi:branched-chain amino acid transport system ATP-binding protein